MSRLFLVALFLLGLVAPALAQDSLHCRQRSHWEPPNTLDESQAVAFDARRRLVFAHFWEYSPEDEYCHSVYLLDLTDPGLPQVVCPPLRFPTRVHRLHYEPGLLYAVSWPNDVPARLWIWDVADAEQPELLGYCDIRGTDEVHGLAVAGNLAYVVAPTTPSGDVRVIDISNPLNPVEIAAWSLPGYACDIAIAGSLAYITGLEDSLFWVVDVSDPQNPVVVSSTRLSEAAIGIAVAGNHAYLSGDKLFVVGISDPQSPVEVGSHPVMYESYRVAVTGSLAYLAAGGAGLRVFDVADPGDPVEVGYYRAQWPLAWDVVVSDNIAYVADRGLRTVEFLGAGVEEQRGAPVARSAPDVRPNPARNRVRLVGTESAVLYAPDGRKVAVLRPGENCVARLPRGVYFVRLATGRPNRLALIR